MEQLLDKLYQSLFSVFNEKLKSKEKKYDKNDDLDVLQTLLTLSKSQREIIKLIEDSSIEKAVLIYDFSKEIFDECLKDKLILQGSTINDSRYFISTYGLYHYYKLQHKNIDNVFLGYDEMKFAKDSITLKAQEKIWCIFLILFGADNAETKLDTSKLSHEELNKYYLFLNFIESKLLEKGISIGKKVSWGSGKDSTFRRFITNNVLLPKTGLYHDRPTNHYHLDLSKRRNAKFLLDLILDNYDGAERIMANELLRESLRELSNMLLIELSIIPKEINHYIAEELYG